MRNLILFIAILVSGFMSAQTFDFSCELTPDNFYGRYNVRWDGGTSGTYVDFVDGFATGGNVEMANDDGCFTIYSGSDVVAGGTYVRISDANIYEYITIEYTITDVGDYFSCTPPSQLEFIGTLPDNLSISAASTTFWDWTYRWAGAEGSVLIEIFTATSNGLPVVVDSDGPSEGSRTRVIQPEHLSVAGGTWGIQLTDNVTSRVISHTFEIEITQ